MRFLDARRLTGPSVLFDSHGSILDVACTTAEAERLTRESMESAMELDVPVVVDVGTGKSWAEAH